MPTWNHRLVLAESLGTFRPEVAGAGLAGVAGVASLAEALTASPAISRPMPTFLIDVGSTRAVCFKNLRLNGTLHLLFSLSEEAKSNIRKHLSPLLICLFRVVCDIEEECPEGPKLTWRVVVSALLG